MNRWIVSVSIFLLGTQIAQTQQVPGLSVSKQWTIERIGENHWKLIGAVEIERDELRMFADEVEIFNDIDRVIARGNVVVNTPESRIAADRADFNLRTQNGIFYNAAGTASLGDKVDRSLFGTLEPDAYFYGETVEKVGRQKYRISKGGFTTCVQPTPRWEVTSSSVTLNLDQYAVLKNSILKVKGVPVMYLPVMYYPIQEDDRATGFLIPMYGTSTFRGHTISNAFFWAISRNQDATFLHDWFSQAGQGRGAEYRYVLGPGSTGSITTYQLNEPERLFASEAGGVTSETVQPGRQSFELRGSATQDLGGAFKATGRMDFFSDITVRQTFNQNAFDLSSRSRTFGGNVSGTWGSNSLNGTFDWNELFFGESDSTLYGSAPRVSFNRAQQQVGPLPIYFSLAIEYANLVRATNSGGERVFDQGLLRLDLMPTLRAPLSPYQWLTVNSSVAWRGTYYSESLDSAGLQVPESLTRRYVSTGIDVVGPVFTKVSDTPNSRYAERHKHIIEPSFSIERITPIENRDQIVALEGSDFLVGGSTRINYGVTNRLLAKRQEQGSLRTREYLTVDFNQSYYTDATASQFDSAFSTSFRGRAPSNFSPIQISVKTAPTEELDSTFQLEWDPDISAVQSMRATGAYTNEYVRASGGWSKQRLGASILDPLTGIVRNTDNFLNALTEVQVLDRMFGGSYRFNYDVGERVMLQQRIVAYYNAQCCGFGFDYQAFNFPVLDPRFPVPQDRRFNFNVTLAGIGSVSNFFSGQDETRGLR